MAKEMKPKRTPFPPTEKQLEKQIIKFYKDGWQETRELIADIHARYANGETLTRTDMVIYNRLSKTEEELSGILSGVYKRNKQYLYESMESAFLFGHFSQAYEMEMMSNALLRFGGVNRRAIEQMLGSSLTGLTLNERLQKNERDIVFRIRQELSHSLLQGESYKQAADRFKGLLEGDTNKAIRVAWTETHRAQEEAAFQSREAAQEQLDFEEVWLSTLDGRTRESHREMDGKVRGSDGFFDVNGYKGRFPGDPMLPASEVVRCRCTTITQFPDRPTGKRRGRLDLDETVRRNNDTFPANWTYDKWYQSRVAKGQTEKFE